jgi:hypothetical protein
MRRATAVLAVLVAAAVAISGGADAAEKKPKRSVAYKLAAIDLGAKPDRATVRQYSLPLNELDSKCNENRTRLGDYTVKTRELLEEKGGQSLPLLQILQSINMSIPPDAPKQRCSDVFAAWVTLVLG